MNSQISPMPAKASAPFGRNVPPQAPPFLGGVEGHNMNDNTLLGSPARKGGRLHNPNYLFEIKWDGERAIAFVENGKIVRSQNRRLQDVGSPRLKREASRQGIIIHIVPLDPASKAGITGHIPANRYVVSA